MCQALIANEPCRRRAGSDAAGARGLYGEWEPLRGLRSPPFPPQGVLVTIRLWPSDPQMCEDLAFFLRRHDCYAEAVEDGTVLVELPHLLHREQAQMEKVAVRVGDRAIRSLPRD